MRPDFALPTRPPLRWHWTQQTSTAVQETSASLTHAHVAPCHRRTCPWKTHRAGSVGDCMMLWNEDAVSAWVA
eukprot:332826-Lingulodinium_polyedra.AAC.1